MISQELMDEIIFASSKNQIISKELIEKIVIDIIHKCDSMTQDIFQGLFFHKLDWNFAIAALAPNGKIIADYDEIVSLCSELDYMTYLEKNLYIIHYLLHEIEHLKEDSKLKKHNSESKILKYGSARYVYYKYYDHAIKKTNDEDKAEKYADKKYKLFYQNNWDIIPCERIAEITARKNVLDSLKNYTDYETNYFKEYKGLTKFYINGLKMGYKKLEPGKYSMPIIEYFSNLKRLSDLEKLVIELNLKTISKETISFDSERKMLYGFPIKPIDVIEINKIRVKGRR